MRPFSRIGFSHARSITFRWENTRPGKGFQVVSSDGKRTYGLRTTLEDFLYFAEAPRDFVANRVNPTLVRVPEELSEGVDQQGHKVSDEQKFFDAPFWRSRSRTRTTRSTPQVLGNQ